MIDVAMTRAQAQPADAAVVVDVLRATSTATQALAAGYEQVLCAESVERAAELRGPGRVLAGERDCLKPAGFDQGNSPLEAAELRGSELVLATTNGAPAVVSCASRADRVLLACVLNLEAVVNALLEGKDPAVSIVQIVCSGTDGLIALEDVYLAGRISAVLPGPRTDAAVLAERVAMGFTNAREALGASAHARTLTAAGLAADVAYCSRESKLEIVPDVLSVDLGVASIGQRTGARESHARRRDTVAV
jgi:2-phosphosulfolactate phosphatase